jgi:hypothetical protein
MSKARGCLVGVTARARHGATLAAAQEVRAKLARLTNLPARSCGEPVNRRLSARALSIQRSTARGYAMRTFGAVFVEVGVDPALGLLRLRRAVGGLPLRLWWRGWMPMPRRRSLPRAREHAARRRAINESKCQE